MPSAPRMRSLVVALLSVQTATSLLVRAPIHGHASRAAASRMRSPIRAQEETPVDVTDDAKADAKADVTPVDDGSFYAGFGAAAGLIANPVVFISLYDVAATGTGLPAGPYDIVGTLEGVSFLVVTSILGAAFVSKIRSGSGLPAGPLGLLGLSEGLSFLSLLGCVVFPLREFGVVGDPATSIVNVPQVTEQAIAAAAPLVATASATLSGLIESSGLSLPELPALDLPALDLPAMPAIEMPAMPAMPDLPALPTELPTVSLPEGLPEIKLPEMNLPEAVENAAD